MTIVFKNHNYAYEVRNVVMLFFQGQTITQADEPPVTGDYILTALEDCTDKVCLTAVVRIADAQYTDARAVERTIENFDNECERVFGIMLYQLLAPITGISPRFGILTGIRPVSLLRRLGEQGMNAAQAEQFLCERYLVSSEKASLLSDIARKESAIITSSTPRSYSLYVSIPFCPSRCLYCSFVSHSIEKTAVLVEQYLDKLTKEIAFAGELVRGRSLRLETVYIGGGTPTTLSAAQLSGLFDSIRKAFDLSTVREYTVEAGRPDTITRDKLCAIHDSEATRISINPQTFRDDVLALIGRKHTAQDTIESIRFAREVGIKCINMDLIAGLPGDTPEGFCDSLDQTIALGPENITVHTLSLKRSSDLAYQKASEFSAREGIATQMLEYVYQTLPQAGYAPYYLYRQRNTRENLENVGFAKDGFEGLYNVFIMDETHTILACGAGGVTKLKGEGLKRIYNYKYPYEYINGFDEILLRKGQVGRFYDRTVL